MRPPLHLSRDARRALVLLFAGGALATAACLNPQPLPPDDTSQPGAGGGASSGEPARTPEFNGDPTSGAAPPPSPSDAAAAPSPDAATDAGADADAGG
jgi:hypothetical protein